MPVPGGAGPRQVELLNFKFKFQKIVPVPGGAGPRQVELERGAGAQLGREDRLHRRPHRQALAPDCQLVEAATQAMHVTRDLTIF